ncbi:hypothetical protein IMCC3317_15660 [Kordia antarctica]|uniref:DUF4328 domain-containing protein n=1 Tax=Kordia antarctica TaxID=1218801 RepID=A0A7L4ZIB4_9FLAO|nr:DUF4328 domain-containing protein [Kordia antarctica]QHI36207.1 hypothetical protein IMCC3317_15660 [Kordia antarctica]
MIFITTICINVISILLLIYQNHVLQNYDNTAAELSKIELLDIIVPISGVFQVVIFIVAIIFFVRWFKKAYGNLIRRHQPMEYSENGSAWGFFIPIINLYRPITTAKEIYLKTQHAIKEYNSNFKVDTETSFIVVWWILYIVNNFFANYASKKIDAAYDIPTFVDANTYLIISEVISIVAILGVLYLIHKITKVETLLKETNESVSSIDEIGTPIV